MVPRLPSVGAGVHPGLTTRRGQGRNNKSYRISQIGQWWTQGFCERGRFMRASRYTSQISGIHPGGRQE